MPQLSLFGTGPQVLLDDASGRIVLTPALVDDATAQRWFDHLLTDVPWEAGHRVMYEREVTVPRLRAHYRTDDPQLPPAASEAWCCVGAALEVPFNSIGLNLYRNEHDSVAAHNDRLDDLIRDAPIAVLSLGATRPMSIRAKKAPRRLMHVDLVAGSLLVMSWNSQFHYDHGIPKQRTATGPRISLAFRVRR